MDTIYVDEFGSIRFESDEAASVSLPVFDVEEFDFDEELSDEDYALVVDLDLWDLV